MRSTVAWVGAVPPECFLTAACDESREEALASRADSAGVEIVTNDRTFAQVPLRARVRLATRRNVTVIRVAVDVVVRAVA